MTTSKEFSDGQIAYMFKFSRKMNPYGVQFDGNLVITHSYLEWDQGWLYEHKKQKIKTSW